MTFKQSLLFGLVGALCQVGVSASAWSADAAVRKDWSNITGDLTNQRYSPLNQINLENIDKLGGAWVTTGFQDGAASRSTPVIHDGMVFVNAGQRVYAMDAASGELTWSWLPDERQVEGLMPRIFAGFGVPNYQGLSVGGGQVYAGLMNGQVAALDEKTGRVKWNVHIGETPRRRGEAVSAAAIYVNGVVFAGLSVGDLGLRGRVVALDAKSGKILWTFFAVPGPGEKGHETWSQDNEMYKIGGAGIWNVGTADPEANLVYFVGGSTAPQLGGEVRVGDNLYTAAVMAIDMKTGKLKWHFQTIHHDIWDADVATAPLLYDIEKDGKLRKAIAVIRPDGYLFLLDRITGEPLVPIEERPVPQNARSFSAKTQPFPVGGDSLLPDCTFWKDKIPKGFVCDSAYFPPSFPPPSKDPQNVLAPWFGVRVTPMSFSPQTGLVYVRGTATVDWRRRTEDPFWFRIGAGFVPGMNGYGYFAAFDAKTSKIVWKQELPPETMGTGGSMTTAGGLVFRLMGDGNFTAMNAKTGAIVWQFQTGHRGGNGHPATYELNGEQHIAIPVGPVVWSFKLGGKVPPSPSSAPIAANMGGGGGALPPAVEKIETTFVHKDMGILGGVRSFIDPYTFNPPRARVQVGQELIFSNGGQTTYTVAALDGSWTTGPIPVTEERRVKFDKPGVYLYRSKEFPWMYGQITVASDQIAKNGAYAMAQATRGKELYTVHCASCHLDSLEGSDQSLPLTGALFADHWNNRTFADLYDRIRTTMPQKNPGSLSPEQYLEIATYLLQANNFPAGPDALRAESPKFKAVLNTVRTAQ